ncbi:MAG: DUF4037 domain-containing protein [Clostridia bacterium]|nr:DUF4037 domain-containing protein [Clostridia bacterium]
MQGLELSRKYYEEYGQKMLDGKFSDIKCQLCVGLCGSGSECLGFDDDISQDHDFEPGFCIFIPGEDIIDRQTAFQLEREYAKLPKEFSGFKRQPLSAVGGNRHGVIRLGDFLTEKLGRSDGKLDTRDWLTISEQYLCEVTGGEIFFDGDGTFSAIRKTLKYLPDDVRLKKLASNLLIMAQAGQYNYLRCLKHTESAAAQLAVVEFVKSAMHAVFLLNKKYMPYYKWSFRALRELEKLSELGETFEYLLTSQNDGDTSEIKYDAIESVAMMIIEELQAQKITDAICGDLEKHAYSVNDHICDAKIRNLNILAGI